MQRILTKDVGANFRAGEVKDYPITVWRQIATNIRARSIDDFSTPVDAAAKEVAKVPVARHTTRRS